MKKAIQSIVSSHKVNMGGIFLEQPLPSREISEIDPFLLIHHWDSKVEVGKKENEAGVGPHPHRGFSPVTFIFKGALHHRDSRGNSSIVEAGGTQWMFAGRGIVHSERPAKEIVEKGGDFEIIQFWVNAPAQHKMDTPIYSPLRAEDTPTFTSSDGKIKVGVVSGTFKSIVGGIKNHTATTILRFDAQEGGKINFDIPENYNTLIYVLDGGITFDSGESVTNKQLVHFENKGTNISFNVSKNTRAILLSGEPINEKVSSYGPFVMNTQTEIMEALRDAQMGKMGVLIEEFPK